MAIERGPVVYCAEQADNPDGVQSKSISTSAEFKPVYISNVLKGVVKLKTENDFTLVPYYAWSHRGLSEMAVWSNIGIIPIII